MTPIVISAFILGMMIGAIIFGCFGFVLLWAHYFKIMKEKKAEIYGNEEETKSESSSPGVA